MTQRSHGGSVRRALPPLKWGSGASSVVSGEASIEADGSAQGVPKQRRPGRGVGEAHPNERPA
eukprot:15454341-Alexandrium_andersonii.AAC.1